MRGNVLSHVLKMFIDLCNLIVRNVLKYVVIEVDARKCLDNLTSFMVQFSILALSCQKVQIVSRGLQDSLLFLLHYCTVQCHRIIDTKKFWYIALCFKTDKKVLILLRWAILNTYFYLKGINILSIHPCFKLCFQYCEYRIQAYCEYRIQCIKR